MSADAIILGEWVRVGESLANWPGSSRIGPKVVGEYVRALRAHTDPVECERVLDELRLEQDSRPSVAAIVVRARRDRRALEPLPDVDPVEPPEGWVLAHAIATGSGLAPYMRLVAAAHGLDPDPEHRPEACALCIAHELELAKLDELEVTFGPDWLRNEQARNELAAFSHELDRRFDWRVPEALRA